MKHHWLKLNCGAFRIQYNFDAPSSSNFSSVEIVVMKEPVQAKLPNMHGHIYVSESSTFTSGECENYREIGEIHSVPRVERASFNRDRGIGYFSGKYTHSSAAKHDRNDVWTRQDIGENVRCIYTLN